MTYCPPPRPVPEGFELFHTKTAVGRRLLCSHTEVARLLQSGELKLDASGRMQFRTEVLDGIRGRQYEKIKAKYGYLRDDEKRHLTAVCAQMSAYENGHREEPNRFDHEVGAKAAEKLIAKKSASVRYAGTGRLCAGPRIRLRATNGGIFN